MKTKPTLLAFLVCAAIAANAQNLITVQHAGTAKFYTKLPDAITGAVAGDTVLIPGGGFDPISINKRLYIIGVGHNPDSTSVTYRTIISDIQLNAGADNGLITGVQTGAITFNANLTGNTISRCNLGVIQVNSAQIIPNKITITENIIAYINLPGINHLLNNNICTSVMGINAGGISNSIIRNNIFLYLAPGNVYTNLHASNCVIENNIFSERNTGSGSGFDGIENIFNNNVNTAIGNGVSQFGQGTGNLQDGSFGLPLSSIFIVYDTSSLNSSDGIYKDNFHLMANSPYKNAGRDGTDIGIYGGTFPWKEGSIPFNPHFQSLNVAPKTDGAGNLKVQITVAAQNN